MREALPPGPLSTAVERGSSLDPSPPLHRGGEGAGGWGLPVLVPTWRLLGLVLAALVPLALTDFAPGIGVVTALLLIGVAALLIVDVRATAPPDRLVVGRLVAERLSLGAENPVVLSLRNRGPRPLRVLVR